MDKRTQLIRILSSAGGGKTYLLSLRYKNLLNEQKENLKRTLAITFTNKAATEMKERILNLLKEEALLGNKHSSVLVDYILNNYSDFHVRTIDSFINSLVKAFSVELGINPEGELLMDSDHYKDLAVSYLIHSIEENEALRAILTNFIINRIEFGGKINWDFHKIIREGMDKIENYERIEDISFKEEKGHLSKLDERIIIYFKKVIKLAEEILKHPLSSKTINQKFLKILEKVTNNREIDSLLESSYLRKDFKLKEESYELYSLLLEIRRSAFKFYELRLMRDYSYQAEVYKAYKEFLEDIKERQRVRFIEDINKELKVLFKDLSVPFIFYRIGENFLHYLIDEFQDTSKDQWQNLLPLIENALSEGGSFFYVGDPKQAIYQWRGGDVKLFDEALGAFRPVGEKEKDSQYIDKNYRSAPVIVEFLGEVFSSLPEKIKEDMGEKRKFYLEAVRQSFPKEKKGKLPKGFVLIKRVYSKEKNIESIFSSLNQELEKTIEDILKRGYKEGDITILVRKNADGKKITEWLCGKGYPVISNETLYLISNPVIKGLLSVLSFLNHPLNNSSFLGFLLSPFFSKKTNLEEKNIIQFVEEIPIGVPYYIQFRKAFPKIWSEYIDVLFRSVGFLPIYDLVTDIIRIFEIPLYCPKEIIFLEAFLEFIHQLEEKSITSIEGFFKEWDRANNSAFPPSILLPEATEAIKIMTIHSAKGLEFPIVILPFTSIPQNKDKNEVVIEYKGIKRIIRIKNEIFPEYNKELKERIKRKIKEKKENWVFEEINNLYVGLSRAKDELYVFLSETPRGYSSLWKEALEGYLTEDLYKKGEAERKISLKEERESIFKDLELKMELRAKESVEHFAHRLILKKKDIHYLLDEEKKKAIKKGELIHKILFYIVDLNDLKEIDFIINRSLNEFNIKEENFFLKKELKSIIKNLFEKEEIKKWFLPGLKVWREKEVISQEGELYRLDRVIVKEKEVDIIDFKTGEEETYPEWEKQLNKYKRALFNFFPGKELKTYIININSKEILEFG
ncbi:MAG: UvrD-helicase domain-containing protein [candidate division WOR-3 bacterium]